MPVSYITPAIVLRSWPFGESDKIVTFLSENHGKITGIAKGAKRSRKRFANSLEPFSLVTLHFQDRSHTSLAFIVASDLTCGFKQLSLSLEKISFASYMIEITEGLTGEREENPLVFQHLRDGLSLLAEQDASLRVLTCFELKLLALAGYRPALDKCRRCGSGKNNNRASSWLFSTTDGGIVCQTCCSRSIKESIPLAPKALELLRDLQAEGNKISSPNLLPVSVVKEIRSVVEKFIQFHVDRQIKSAPFLYNFSTP